MASVARRENPARNSPDWARAARRALDGLIFALIVTSPIALGGMLPAAQAIFSLVAVVLCVAALVVNAALQRGWRWEPLVWVMVAAAVLTLFRASPLGAVLASAAERSAVSAWGDLSLRGTVAPGRAALGALKLIGLAAFIQVCAIRLRERDSARLVVGGVFGATAVCALIGFLHHTVVPSGFFGLVIDPTADGILTRFAAPFVNKNQAAALYGLAATLAFVIAWVMPERRLAGVMLGGALCFIPAAVFHATAVTVAIGCALLALLLIAPLAPVSQRRYALVIAAIGAVVAVAGAVMAWGVLPQIDTDARWVLKSHSWRDALSLIIRRPFGWGVGAFPDVFGSVDSGAAALRAGFIESTPLQIAFDHGPLIACFGGVALVRAFGRRLFLDSRIERDLRGATVVVAVYVAIEAIGGMGLEAFGVAFPVCALLGFAIGRANRRSDLEVEPRRTAAGLAALLVATALCFPGLAASIELGASSVEVHLRSANDVAAAAAELAPRVPADAVLMTWAAAEALRVGDRERARRFIDHLRVYAPGRAATWDLAVELELLDGRRDEACVSARRLGKTRHRVEWFLAALERIDDDPRRWLDCAVEREEVARMYLGLSRAGRSADALALALVRLEQHPDEPESLLVAIEGLVELGATDYALRLAGRLSIQEAPSRRAAIAVARLYTAAGRHLDALRVLDAATDDGSEATLLLERLRVLVSWSEGDRRVVREQFESTYQRLLPMAAESETVASRRVRFGATFYRSEGLLEQAEAALRAMIRMHPNDARALRQLAEVVESRGRGLEAEQHRERARRLESVR